MTITSKVIWILSKHSVSYLKRNKILTSKVVYGDRQFVKGAAIVTFRDVTLDRAKFTGMEAQSAIASKCQISQF